MQLYVLPNCISKNCIEKALPKSKNDNQETRRKLTLGTRGLTVKAKAPQFPGKTDPLGFRVSVFHLSISTGDSNTFNDYSKNKLGPTNKLFSYSHIGF